MFALFAVLCLLLIVAAVGTLLVVLPSLLKKIFKAEIPNQAELSVRQESYECGVPEQTTGHSKIPVKFYLTAILFILFDIEIIFMYPWAVTFLDFQAAKLGGYVLTVMGLFLAVFIFGLIWEIKSNALEWE